MGSCNLLPCTLVRLHRLELGSHLVDWISGIPPNAMLASLRCYSWEPTPHRWLGLGVTVELVTVTWMYGFLY
jgi:hypothetical protein